MIKYKINYIQLTNNKMSLHQLTFDDLSDAIFMRNLLKTYKNVLTVSNPIVWFGAGGHVKCQKLLKMWPNSGKITEK